MPSERELEPYEWSAAVSEPDRRTHMKGTRKEILEAERRVDELFRRLNYFLAEPDDTRMLSLRETAESLKELGFHPVIYRKGRAVGAIRIDLFAQAEFHTEEKHYECQPQHDHPGSGEKLPSLEPTGIDYFGEGLSDGGRTAGPPDQAPPSGHGGGEAA